MQTLIRGNLVDIHLKSIYPAEMVIEAGKIKSIHRLEKSEANSILPGFVDAHIHIESSLLVPEAFSYIALRHGTVATVSDPHEIANVCGLAGVDFMIKNGEGSKMKFFWTAPSCVPATEFETSGAKLNDADLAELLKNPKVVALGEMMNYPGVIFEDKKVLDKIDVSKGLKKPVDGHAPGLNGENLKAYVGAGISTDHECATLEEALEKISLGMKILIREGSSAKNFDALWPLLINFPNEVMLCSDDLHADNLLSGHLNLLVKKALNKGVPLFNVLQAVSLNPVVHYKLPVGLLREGDSADFIVLDDLDDFNILETWIRGERVYKASETITNNTIKAIKAINNFNSSHIMEADLKIRQSSGRVQVIKVDEGSILTGKETLNVEGDFETFLKEKDILLLFVKDRYKDSLPSKALVRGFGPLKGAIASTIAHDSHNLIAIGNNIPDIVTAMNLLVQSKGGISFVSGDVREQLSLPIAGLMSDLDAQDVAFLYERIIRLSHDHGCVLRSPLMTLSFLALPVIPSLKLSDKGLFDVDEFSFTQLFV